LANCLGVKHGLVHMVTTKLELKKGNFALLSTSCYLKCRSCVFHRKKTFYDVTVYLLSQKWQLNC